MNAARLTCALSLWTTTVFGQAYPIAGAYDPAGAAAAAQAAIAAQMPQPASTVPPTEMPGGAAGAAVTYRRGDAVQPRITRVATVTTAADGTATFDWTTQGAIDVKSAAVFGPTYTGAVAPACTPTAQTTTSITIKCTAAPILSIAGVSVLGLPVAAAGLKVSITMIPPS